MSIRTFLLLIFPKMSSRNVLMLIVSQARLTLRRAPARQSLYNWLREQEGRLSGI